MSAMEEQKSILESFTRQKETNSNVCNFCQKAFNQAESPYFIQSSECLHQVHFNCFKMRSKQYLLENKTLYCPVCAKSISVLEMREHLSKEDIKALDTSSLNQVTGKQSKIAKCPCGFLTEIATTQSGVDYSERDEAGQTISPAAAIHSSMNQIHCRSCKRKFCRNCEAIPYHIGKSCEEFAKRQI